MESIEKEEKEEEREEMQPFTTCPLYYHCAIGHKTVSSLPVVFVMGTGNKGWLNTCSSPVQHSFNAKFLNPLLNHCAWGLLPPLSS